jgi:hypothetical protein
LEYRSLSLPSFLPDEPLFSLCISLSGDDTYVVVENLRRLLQQVQEQTDIDEPVHLGQWIRQKNLPYIAGGPGYTVNRAALKRFAKEALPICHTEQKASHEDRLFSQCMQSIGILPRDTRDVETGEQQYHDCSPHHLYTSRVEAGKRGSFHSRAAAYWETLPFPDRPYLTMDNLLRNAEKQNESVGPRDHLESAAVYSVALHNLFNPLYLARVHAILYHTCPPESQGSATRRVKYIASERVGVRGCSKPEENYLKLNWTF